MRLVFFNYAHPQTPHVSGVRLWQFAHALARRGHQVIHVTATLRAGDPGITVDELPRVLERHDWSTALHLPVKPLPSPVLEAIRRESVPGLMRKLLTAYSFLVHGGVFYDWTLALKRYYAPLAASFKPDLAWGTFGNSSNLEAARHMAEAARCRFVVDVKDSVFTFLPFGIRKLLALRYRNAAAVTVNARVLLRDAMFLCWRDAAIVYSGVDAAFFEDRSAAPAPGQPNRLDITLTGSVRSSVRLREFLTACKRLRERLDGEFEVHVTYAGNGRVEVEGCCAQLEIGDWIACSSYLAIGPLAALVRSAHINAYISAALAGFHHKLLELVAAGKPVIAYGGELEESIELAQTAHASFYCPANQADLDAVLEAIVTGHAHVIDRRAAVSVFSWDSQALALESVFERAMAAGR